MRHVYSLLGIGTVGTANILDYISSQSSPDLFAGGNGLSSTGFLDVFYLCGRVMILYAIGCALIGFLLRKWEARALRSNVAMFFLCISLPSLFFVQRFSVFAVTSRYLLCLHGRNLRLESAHHHRQIWLTSAGCSSARRRFPNLLIILKRFRGVPAAFCVRSGPGPGL